MHPNHQHPPQVLLLLLQVLLCHQQRHQTQLLLLLLLLLLPPLVYCVTPGCRLAPPQQPPVHKLQLPPDCCVEGLNRLL
jgi:hypothetical protein